MNREPYGGLPPANQTETSIAAAQGAIPFYRNLRERVFWLIQEAPNGRTNEELSTLTDRPIQSICPRVRELYLKGMIRDSGFKRLTKSGRQAVVWID